MEYHIKQKQINDLCTYEKVKCRKNDAQLEFL